MIKYLLPKHGNSIIKINTENLDNFDLVEYHATSIDWLWIVDEDGVFNDNPVHKGDIIIRFYSLPGKKDSCETIIVTDNGMKDYYKRYDEALIELENNRKESCGDSVCCEKCA